MSVVEVLEELGCVASRAVLLGFIERADLERALDAGDVERDARGRYALPGADEAVRVAVRLGGVVGMANAALHHGWAVKTVPTIPSVVVSRGRRIPSDLADAVVYRAVLETGDVDGHWTSQEITLEHCLRRLPYDEALCIADSARREGVGQDVFDRLAMNARGPGSAQIKRICDACTPEAANPFETCGRAICDEVPGLSVLPQVDLEGLGFRADLVDVRLRLVIECDFFEWHGKKSALEADARRYNAMVSNGWIVIRLCYHDVMHRPDEVRDLLRAVVALAELLKKALEALPRAA